MGREIWKFFGGKKEKYLLIAKKFPIGSRSISKPSKKYAVKSRSISKFPEILR
jgi:hypothetical protein